MRGAIAATLGSIVGITVGGALGLAGTRMFGMEQSVADYGSSFWCVVAAAWIFGVLGCFVALRSARDPRALLSSLLLAPLLAAPPLLVVTVGQEGSGWDFRSLVVAVIVEVLWPVTSPAIAYLLAGVVHPSRHAATA